MCEHFQKPKNIEFVMISMSILMAIGVWDITGDVTRLVVIAKGVHTLATREKDESK